MSLRTNKDGLNFGQSSGGGLESSFSVISRMVKSANFDASLLDTFLHVRCECERGTVGCRAQEGAKHPIARYERDL